MADINGYRPIQNGWPMGRTDFKVGNEKPLVVMGQAVYALALPEWMYPIGSSRFENIDRGNSRALAFAMALELLLFTLNVIYNRINYATGSWADYPVSVYLEALTDRDDDEDVVEHRLIIVERSGSETSFSDIYAEAWQNVRDPLLPDGTFLEPDKSVKQRKPAQPASANASNEFNIYELYKRIHDKEAMVIMCGALLKISMTGDMRAQLCTDRPINDKDNFLHPKKQYSLPNAFELTSERVNSAQRNLAAYGRHDEGRVRLSFPNQDKLFRIPPQFWRVVKFMSRIFPCAQENRVDTRWEAHMQKTCKIVKEKEAEAARAKKNSKRGMGQDFTGVGRSGRHRDGTSRGANAADIGAAAAALDPEDDIDIDDPRALSRVNADVVGASPQSFGGVIMNAPPGAGDGTLFNPNGGNLRDFCRVREMTKEEMEDNRELLDIADSHQSRTMGFLDDFVGEMKMHFREQASLIYKAYGDDKDKLVRAMNTLKDVTFDRFERLCTGEFNVSATQAKLNNYWNQNGLKNLHFELPVVDPTLTAFDNFLIWMTEGAGIYEGIATNQALFTFIWLNLYAIFDRSPTVHTNMYIHGDAGTGKTFITDRVMCNCLRDTIEDVTSESKLFNTVNATSSDNCLYNEDGSIRKHFEKGDGADAQKRYEMSAQKTIRKVLELTKDDFGQTVRKTVTYINKAPTLYIDCGNETEGDLGSDLMTSKDALISRYIFVYIRRHNNTARRIGDNRPPVMNISDFRNINIKAHCIRGWYAKLCDIMEGYHHISMQCFDDSIPVLRHGINSLGLDYSTNRTEYMMRKYAQGCAIHKEYISHHCVPTGMYFGQSFRVGMMRSWMPVCDLNIVIHTFGRFIDSFVPPALKFTLQYLRERVINHGKDKSKKIRFPGKKGYGQDDNQRNAQGGFQSGASRFGNNRNQMPQTSHNMNKTPGVARAGGSTGGGSTLMLHPPGGGFPAFLRRGDGNDEVYGDDEDVPAGVPNIPKGPEEYDGTWVLFGDETYRSLSKAIHVASKNTPVIYSAASIEQCLVSLEKLSVFSHKYVFLSQDQETPLPKDNEPRGYHEAGVRNGRFGVMVNWGLLCENGMYDDIMAHCIQGLFYENTLVQDFLSGVTIDDYPWLYERIKMHPNQNRRMILRNGAYVCDYSLMSVFGNLDRSLISSFYSNMFNGFETDIDTHCLLEAVRANGCVKGDLTVKDIAAWHPYHIQNALMQFYKLCLEKGISSPLTGKPYTFFRYPDFARAELDSIRNNTVAALEGNYEDVCMQDVNFDVYVGNDEMPVSENDKNEINTVLRTLHEGTAEFSEHFLAHKPNDSVHRNMKRALTQEPDKGVPLPEELDEFRANIIVKRVRLAEAVTGGIVNFFDDEESAPVGRRPSQYEVARGEGDGVGEPSMLPSNEAPANGAIVVAQRAAVDVSGGYDISDDEGGSEVALEVRRARERQNEEILRMHERIARSGASDVAHAPEVGEDDDDECSDDMDESDNHSSDSDSAHEIELDDDDDFA